MQTILNEQCNAMIFVILVPVEVYINHCLDPSLNASSSISELYSVKFRNGRPFMFFHWSINLVTSEVYGQGSMQAFSVQ